MIINLKVFAVPKLTLNHRWFIGGKYQKKRGCKPMIYNLLAEREGFEPPVPRSTTVFKTAAIDHSAISPELLERSALFQKRCKGTTYF